MTDEVLEVPTVRVEGGVIDGHSVAISQGTSLIVGSGRLANLRLDHPQIELAHIKITWDDLGIAMTDNGSRYGTWVNGEKVEGAALIDGDVITFAPADAQPPCPRIRMRIPKGSVAEPPPPPPEEATLVPPAPAPTPSGGKAAARPRRGRRRRAFDFALPFGLPEPRILAFVAGGLVAVLGLGWLGARLLTGGGGPSLSAVQPSLVEAGQGITLTGSRFARDALKNTVWFGDVPVSVDSAAGDTLKAKVPEDVPPGPVSVSVETAGGRSSRITLRIAATLQATALEPAGALPGDAVELQGRGLDGESPALTVGGVPAKLLATSATSLRFEMPAIEGAPGSFHPVVATVGGRGTNPLEIALGRLPLVLSLVPVQARSGDLVKIQGLGFPENPAGAEVSFEGVRALVVTSTPREILAVTPLVPGTTPQTAASVSVRAGGRVSSGDVRFPIVRLTSGTYAMRFFAAAGEPGAPGSASLATEMGPVLLLGGKQAALRAVQVAKALNDILQLPRSSPLVFVAQEQPESGVSPEGAPALLLASLDEDAAVYGPARGAAAPTTAALARWWAALLNDYVTIGSGPDSPDAVAAIDSRAGSALKELRQALPFRYRAGVANDRVAALPERLRARLREVAVGVP